MSKSRTVDAARAGAPGPAGLSPIVRRHLRFGWWCLLLFLSLGALLELMHGFKVDWYLNVANHSRRLMWRLAHAHGVLLGLVNVAFALSLRALGESTVTRARTISYCLAGATVLLPGGFLLGGVVVHAGDPGRGVLLVPFGAALLFVGVLLFAWRTSR